MPGLVFAAFTLQGQTQKGMLVIGGSGDISESIQGTTTNFNFSLQPSFGAFVINNFAIGGSYGFSAGSNRTFNPNNDTHTTTTTFNTSVGPFLRYYIGKKGLKPFVAVNGGYAVYTQLRSTSNSTTGASVTNYDGFTLTGQVGLAYFLNPHVSIQTALYLSDSGYQTLLPTTRFGFSLGVYAFLDKKKPE